MRSVTNISQEAVDLYFSKIAEYAVLSKEDETALATRFLDTGDINVAHQLVRSNLRFVVKIAHEYRGYGLDLQDLIQEGNIGLMMAVKKFDPSRGYRLISYAVWWIRAFIQSYVMRSWSLVKVGTTQAQRKLFFKLRSTRSRLDGLLDEGNQASANEVASELGVPQAEVETMDLRMAARDFSLDVNPVMDGRHTYKDRLVDETPDQEETLNRNEVRDMVRNHLDAVMKDLSEREGHIVKHRLMADQPQTLQQIGRCFRISRERARQIQNNVLHKLRIGFQTVGLDAAA